MKQTAFCGKSENDYAAFFKSSKFPFLLKHTKLISRDVFLHVFACEYACI